MDIYFRTQFFGFSFFFSHFSLHFLPPIFLPESLSNHSILSSFSDKSAEVEIKCHLFCLHTSLFFSEPIMIGPKWFLSEMQAGSLNENTRETGRRVFEAGQGSSATAETPGTQPHAAPCGKRDVLLGLFPSVLGLNGIKLILFIVFSIRLCCG